MADPFRTVAFRGLVTKTAVLVLLAALASAVAYLRFGTVVYNGQVVKGEVVRFGTRAAARAAGGDLPILTVRLPDGSIREVEATWADVNDCKPGRSISLIQRGVALQIGRPGCSMAG